jgi:hypothetical protein
LIQKLPQGTKKAKNQQTKATAIQSISGPADSNLFCLSETSFEKNGDQKKDAEGRIQFGGSASASGGQSPDTIRRIGFTRGRASSTSRDQGVKGPQRLMMTTPENARKMKAP